MISPAISHVLICLLKWNCNCNLQSSYWRPETSHKNANERIEIVIVIVLSVYQPCTLWWFTSWLVSDSILTVNYGLNHLASQQEQTFDLLLFCSKSWGQIQQIRLGAFGKIATRSLEADRFYSSVTKSTESSGVAEVKILVNGQVVCAGMLPIIVLRRCGVRWTPCRQCYLA